jgi:hypothetical protein
VEPRLRLGKWVLLARLAAKDRPLLTDERFRFEQRRQGNVSHILGAFSQGASLFLGRSNQAGYLFLGRQRLRDLPIPGRLDASARLPRGFGFASFPDWRSVWLDELHLPRRAPTRALISRNLVMIVRIQFQRTVRNERWAAPGQIECVNEAVESRNDSSGQQCPGTGLKPSAGKGCGNRKCAENLEKDSPARRTKGVHRPSPVHESICSLCT